MLMSETNHGIHTLKGVEKEVAKQRARGHEAANLFHGEGYDSQADLLCAVESYQNALYEIDTTQPRDRLGCRLALFLDEEFLDSVYTLDLLFVENPENLDELALAKEQYIETRANLQQAGICEDELPRDGNTRFNFLPLSNMEHNDTPLYNSKNVVGTRNRNLIVFAYRDKIISIKKRMVFLAESHKLNGLFNEYGHVETSQQSEALQALIDTEDESITPLDTVYYVTATTIDT